MKRGYKFFWIMALVVCLLASSAVAALAAFSSIVSLKVGTDYSSVIVKFSKAQLQVNKDDFSFSNGLAIESASLAADKKTVTLKTAPLAIGAKYYLYYQGKNTGKYVRGPALSNVLSISSLSVDKEYGKVTLRVRKALYALQAEDFNFVPALAVTDVQISSDGKTVVFVTDGLQSKTKYTLYYKGFSTGKYVNGPSWPFAIKQIQVDDQYKNVTIQFKSAISSTYARYFTLQGTQVVKSTLSRDRKILVLETNGLQANGRFLVLYKGMRTGFVAAGPSYTYSQAGTYGPASGIEVIDSDVKVAAAGVTLRNLDVKGDLVITAAVGDGDVQLDNVTVRGQTIVQGGGENSVRLNSCKLQGKMVVDKAGSPVRVVASGTTEIPRVEVKSAAKLEESNVTGSGFASVTVQAVAAGQQSVVLNGDFSNVTVAASGAKLEVVGGKVGTLQVESSAAGSQVSLGNVEVGDLQVQTRVEVAVQGATVDKLQVSDAAADAQIKLQSGTLKEAVLSVKVTLEATGGTLTRVTVGQAAAGAVLKVAAGARVTDMVLEAAVSVQGQGTIEKATVKADGVSIEIKPLVTNVDPAVKQPVQVGGVAVQPGTSVTADGQVSQYNPGGSTGGGTTPGGSTGGSTGGDYQPPTPTINVSSVSVQFAGEDNLITQEPSNNIFEFNLSNKSKDAILQKVSIVANVSTADLYVETVKAKGLTISFNKKILTGVTLENVSPGALLGGFDTGTQGVALGTLRYIFGDEVEVSGKLQKSGYYDSNKFTVKLRLGTDQPAYIENQWVVIDKYEPRKAYVLIKSSAESVTLGQLSREGFRLSEVLSVLLSQDGGNLQVSGINSQLLEALQSVLGSEWVLDQAELGRFKGKTVTFGPESNKYTVEFRGTN